MARKGIKNTHRNNKSGPCRRGLRLCRNDGEGSGLSLCNLVVSAKFTLISQGQTAFIWDLFAKIGRSFYVSSMAVKMSGFFIEFCTLYFKVLPRVIMKFLWGM